MNRAEFTESFSIPSRLLILAFLGGFIAMDMNMTGEPGALVRIAVYAVCGVIGFGARGTLLDKASGKAVLWQGLNLFVVNLRLMRRFKPLSQYSQAVVRMEETYVQKQKVEVYRVLLTGKGPELPLADCSSRQQARVLCREAAAVLGGDMVDASGATTERRGAGELDDSLRESRLRKPAEAGLPALPERSLLRTEVTQEGLRVRIPAVRYSLEHARILGMAALLAAALGVIGWTAYTAVVEAGSGVSFTILLFSTGASIALLAGAYPGLRAALVQDELLVSTAGVRVRRSLLFLSRTMGMRADDIQRLEVGGPIRKDGLEYLSPSTDALHVFGRKGTLSLGYGLSRAELDWLQATITDYAGS